MSFSQQQLEVWMQQCIELAKHGQGAVHPNPMVGCIIVNEQGDIIAQGYHHGYGQPHAEADALAQLNNVPNNATLVVNLEPCSHHGKTPPCAEAIINSGIKTVVYGLKDPNPKVAGAGLEKLQQAGINLIGPILPDACAQLNEAFLHRIKTDTPFMVSKIAQTLDGFIATQSQKETPSGQIDWITNEHSRHFVHQLRAQSDAILSTASTVIADNAQLTVRNSTTPQITPPSRIILDRRLKLADHINNLALFTPDALDTPLVIITSLAHTHSTCAEKLTNAGATIIGVDATETTLDLNAVVGVLNNQRFTQVLVEAGSGLNSSLFNAQLIHKVWLMMGNQLLGDPQALNTLNFGASSTIANSLHLTLHQAQLVQNNLWVEATPHY